MPERSEAQPEKPDRQNVDHWQKVEYDAVMTSMKAALGNVDFPATKSDIARDAGGAVPVAAGAGSDAEVGEVPLVKYVQALPDRRYRSAEDVTSTLTAKWQDLLAYRDANWEADAARGTGGR